MKGFKSFLMQGDLIVIAVGLVVALAFSTLIKAFTDSIITPLVNAVQGGKAGDAGLGWTVHGQRILFGNFISAIVYFVIFMFVIYLVLVVPYRAYMKSKRRDRVRSASGHEDLSALPVRRSPGRCFEVPALRKFGNGGDDRRVNAPAS